MLRASIIFLIINFANYNLLAQSCINQIDKANNLGIYGGLALDLCITPNGRLLASAGVPASLFISDDSAQTWYKAYPNDSLEYECGERGWGGGSEKIGSNSNNWVCVFNNVRNSVVINTSNGDTNQWHTLADVYSLKQLGVEIDEFSDMELSDYFVYLASGSRYIIRTDTSFIDSTSIIDSYTLSNMDTNLVITDIALPNSNSGYPIYFVADSFASLPDYKIRGQLFKYDGINVSKISLSSSVKAINSVFTHPGQITGDTLIICVMLNNNKKVNYRSYDGGLNWNSITNPSLGDYKYLKEVQYNKQWQSFFPKSNGMILVYDGSNAASFDMGDSWKLPSTLDTTGVLFYPNDLAFGLNDTSYVYAAGTAVVHKSTNGMCGDFSKTVSNGFEGILVWDIERNINKSIFYLATQSGLAYTTRYKDSLVDKWDSPYGIFPVSGTDISGGIDAVAINPWDSLHVIASYKDGFFVTKNGPENFYTVSSPDSISSIGTIIKDIKFITQDIVIAVSGTKSPEMGGSNKGDIYRSIDGGDNWSIVSPTTFGGGNTIAVGYGTADTVIYIGTGLGNVEKGELYASTDSGKNWSLINQGPNDQFDVSRTTLTINEIEVDPRGSDTLYMVTGYEDTRAFVKSYDRGLSYIPIWFEMDSTDDAGFLSIEIDANNPDSLMYFVNTRSVYLYNAAKDSFNLLFSGYPRDNVFDLAIGSILVGTTTGFYSLVEDSSNGVIVSDNNHYIHTSQINIYPNPVSSYINIQSNETVSCKYILNLYSFTGQLIYEKDFTLYSGLSEKISLNHLSDGMYRILINSDKANWSENIIIKK